jgi:hypothetical protein
MLNSFNMQHRTWWRESTVGISRWKDERLRVEQALDWDNREHVTAIGMATVVKADIAPAAIEAGVAGVAAALQLLASGIGRQDGGWQSGHPEALEENIITILGRDTEKPFT